MKIWYKNSCYLNYLDKNHTNIEKSSKKELKEIKESIKKLNDDSSYISVDEHKKLINIIIQGTEYLKGCDNLETAGIEVCKENYLNDKWDAGVVLNCTSSLLSLYSLNLLI